MQHVQTESMQGAREGRESHTQIVVALIGAAATIITAVTGYVLANRDTDGGAGQTAKGPTHELSAPAATLVDESTADCSGGGPDSPRNDWVTITSPATDAEVGEKVPVEGTVKLLEGNHLYFFSFAPGLCRYYFNPQEPLHPESNGRWTREAVLVESGGATIPLIAAVVNDKTDAAFKEIIRLRPNEEFLRRLPPQAPFAKISVHVRDS